MAIGARAAREANQGNTNCYELTNNAKITDGTIGPFTSELIVLVSTIDGGQIEQGMTPVIDDDSFYIPENGMMGIKLAAGDSIAFGGTFYTTIPK